MLIAVCDDEPVQLTFIQSLIKEWNPPKKESFDVRLYQNAESFLFDYESFGEFQILILDIEMPGMNGMELAQKLRSRQDQIQIILISGKTEYVYDGYFVDAISYLLKPIQKERFYQCLRKAIDAIAKTAPFLIAEENQTLRKVNLHDIIYIESFQHDTYLHTANEEIRNKHGISEVEAELINSNQQMKFFRIHRSYLVSIDKIKCITKKEVIMESDTALPLARGKWENLNRSYLDYYRRTIR